MKMITRQQSAQQSKPTECLRIQKLHLGCGNHILQDWVNTDFNPVSPEVLFLDASVTFPYGENTFDYILTEHQIEHIPFLSGYAMLENCLRVLKPGGKIRIATPDFAVLVALYQTPVKTEIQKRFMDHICDYYLNGLPQRFGSDVEPEAVEHYQAMFVINNAFRNWGHQFLYDEPMLRALMERVGFVNITRYEPGLSDDIHFLNVEYRGRHPVNVFETFVLEGRKPPR